MTAKLPVSWKRTTLGQATSVNPRSFTKPPTDDDLVSFVPMAAVEAGTGRLDASQARPWKEIKKGYTPFQDGDVLFAKITPCMENGKAALATGLTGGRAAGSTEFHVVRSTGATEPKFILHFLLQESFRRAARANMKGTAGQLRVPADFMASAEIPLPPLPEQRRIVAEIEKQFTRLEAGVAALRRVQANLHRYRAAVLKAACEGRLVPADYGRAHTTAKAHELPVVGAPDLPKLPASWRWAKMHEVCSKVQDGTHFSPKDQSATGDFKYITAKNIKHWGLDLSNVTYVKEETHRYLSQRCNPEKGDVLYIKDGVTTGIATVNPLDEEFTLLSSVALLKPKRDIMLPQFLKYYLNSPEGYRRMTGKMTGTAIKRIILRNIKEAAVPVPPLAEQERIVAEVERRLSVVEELSALVTANLQRATRLRQSILQQAFSGAL